MCNSKLFRLQSAVLGFVLTNYSEERLDELFGTPTTVGLPIRDAADEVLRTVDADAGSALGRRISEFSGEARWRRLEFVTDVLRPWAVARCRKGVAIHQAVSVSR